MLKNMTPKLSSKKYFFILAGSLTLTECTTSLILKDNFKDNLTNLLNT